MSLRYQIIGSVGSNRRRDRRYEIPPLQVAIGGAIYTTTNWSLGGVLLDGYKGVRRPGESVQVNLIAHDGDVAYQHAAETEVVRVGPAPGELALHFKRMDPETLDTLEHLIMGRLRRMRRPGSD